MSLKRVIGPITGLIWGVKMNSFNEKKKEKNRVEFESTSTNQTELNH